ncbi:MAG: hypothetical protein R3B38_01385 [Patescibacteria group bacterium]
MQDELISVERQEVIKLSPSTLNLYLECPRCLWLSWHRKIKRPSGIFPSLPGGMDLVLKEYFDHYRGGDSLPPIVADKLPGKLMNPLPKTLMYKDSQRRAILIGKLDDALEIGEGLHSVMDHKTRGFPPKDGILFPYQLQMDVYDFLMQESGFPTDHRAYLVYYYPTPGQLHNDFPFVVEVKDVLANPTRAKQVFEDTVKMLRDKMPAASDRCIYCNWAEQINNLEV